MPYDNELPEQCDVALRMVRDALVLGYDTETSGVRWVENQPIGYVFTADDTSLYIPIRHGGGGNIPGGVPMETPTDKIEPHPFEVALARAFADRTKPTVGHNLKFDCHMSANSGVWLPRHLSDTQNYACLLDEYRRSYSLDACAADFNVPAKKGDELYAAIGSQFGVSGDRKSMEHFWRMSGSDPLVQEYAAGDGTTTLALWHAMTDKIAEQGLQEVAQLEDELVYVLFDIERRGIKIDQDYMGEINAWINDQEAEALRTLPDGFNARSPVALKALCEDSGHTNWPITEKGNPSYTEKFLSTFTEGQMVVQLRQIQNLRNTFVGPLFEEHMHEGRVHTNYNQNRNDDYGTNTGRLSSNGPNLQAVPKRNKKVARPLRRAFIPDEGMRFVEGDFSQAEPRLFAHYAGCKALIEGYSSDPVKDSHAMTMELLHKDRDSAKRLNMGLFTGLGKKSLAGHLDVPLAEATEAYNAWFRAYPEIREFQNLAQRTWQRRDIFTILGRRCRLERRNFAYKATSRIIQGSGADIMKWALVRAWEYCDAHDGVDLLGTIHDSLVWQSNDPKHDEAIRAIMVDLRGEPFKLSVPFEVDLGSGSNWAEASFGTV